MAASRWTAKDCFELTVVTVFHLLCLLAPYYFTWPAFWVGFGLYVVTGLLGIMLSYHRNLSHRSFKLPKWLEYFCAYCGLHALQGDPIWWVCTHRYHHQYVDTKMDPHSPVLGFWFSHMGWFFDIKSYKEKCGEVPTNVPDLEKEFFYRFLRKTGALHSIALALLLYKLGGVPFLIWGMVVRTIALLHVVSLLNSACHTWGQQAWNTGDLSRNNWWVAILAFGEGWHNNHHAFWYSARHGLEWWQIDMTWYTVKFFQTLGLATNVKLPTESHKKRMAFKNE